MKATYTFTGLEVRGLFRFAKVHIAVATERLDVGDMNITLEIPISATLFDQPMTAIAEHAITETQAAMPELALHRVVSRLAPPL